MYNLKIRMPNLGTDTEIELAGLGVFKNNTTNSITKEQEEAFIVAGTTYNSSFDENGNLVVTKVPGPDLQTAFANAYGVTVSVARTSTATAATKSESGE